jgi:hypothetical protein
MFSWKVQDGIGDFQYARMRTELARGGLELKPLETTRNFLRSTLQLYMMDIHRCQNNCIAFSGKYKRFLCCPYCSEWRFHEHSSGRISTEELAIEVHAEDDSQWQTFTPFKANAIYHYIPLIHRL